MQTTKLPYEFLARWDQAGRLSGVHVQHRYVTRADDGTILTEAVAPPEALTLDTAAGHPLGDLLSQAQIDALTAKAAAETERDAALALRDAAVAERDAALEARAGTESARQLALTALKKAQDEANTLRKELGEAQKELAAARKELEAVPASQSR